MKREPLEVERLIRDDQRFTIADHEKGQADLRATQAAQQPADEIDASLEADPMIERIARRRKNSEAARTLAILDSLKEGATEA
jgi:anti-sigma-K factor RskA